MKFTIKKKVKAEVDLKTLHIRAGVRYWEDAVVNGIEDNDGTLIPCREDKDADNWYPVIDIETGRIINWQEGTIADIHYKVCDDGDYYLFSDDKETPVIHKSGYVPDCVCAEGEGYGDYIKMHVDSKGFIRGWKFNIKDFTK